MILPAVFRVDISMTRALFKVRKEDVELQNIKVLIGSWMGRNVM